jgi:hypothetical protein
MRITVLIFALISFLSPKAQTYLPFGSMNYTQWQPFSGFNPTDDSNHLGQKWYLSKYVGFSAGFGFVNGVSAGILSVPVGLQLNRQLNNNLVAFAGVSAGPSLFSFSRSFMDPASNKSYPGSLSNAYGFGMNSSVQMGLMYINDAKTFSISGSIGIDRSSYPAYPVSPPNRVNTKKQ